MVKLGKRRMRASGVGSTALILRLARDRHGLVTRAELLVAGLSHDTIHRQIRSGLLKRLHAGVYQVGPIAAPNSRERAATLACRGGAISYLSALAFRQLTPPQQPGQPVDVTVCTRGGRRPGIRAHRDSICADEITMVHGIRVTSIARTLIDVSTVLNARQLEQAIAGAERADPKTVQRTKALLERYPARKGTPLLRRMLFGTAAYARSELEERSLALFRDAGFAQPKLNITKHGFELDCYWPEAGVAVELDGYEYHRTREDFERDHRRDTALAARGIHVIRITWQQVTRESIRTVAQIAQALARASRK